MPESIEELKAKLKDVEEELATYKLNGAIGLYYELNRIVNETMAYTRSTTIKSLIKGEDGDSKGDKKFERTMLLIKNAKDHIVDLEEIKNKLGLSGDEDKDRQRKPFIDRIAEKRQ